MKKLVCLMIMFMAMSVLCSCSGDEREMPYGTYSSSQNGSIIFDENGISFENVSSELLGDLYAKNKASLEWFENKNEGILLSDDDTYEIYQKYLMEFDADEYVNAEFSYESEYYEDDYTVYFVLYNEDGQEVFEFTYYMEGRYILLNEEEFDFKE